MGAGRAWYVVRCAGHSDSRVVACLEALGLETYYPVVRELRPLAKKRMSHAQRASGVAILRPTAVPFLPRHVFVEMDVGAPAARGEARPIALEHFVAALGPEDGAQALADYERVRRRRPAADWWQEIFDIAGVAGFVAMDDRPVAIASAEIAALRAREVDGVIPGKTPAGMIFELGERVRIVEGPFTTFDGFVEQLPDVPLEQIDAGTRLRLTIAGLLGRSTVVDVTIAQVEKLPR
jgi:transcription antitermination factor NusG